MANQTIELGKSGLQIGRIGISSSYGADHGVFEAALERGCNYFNWGTFIRGRSGEFKKFMHHVGKAGKREQVVVGLLSYSHTTILGNHFLQSALRQLSTDYVDTLILGYYSRRPPQRILDWAQEAKSKGMIRAIAMTTHNRRIIAPLAQEGVIDYFHIRYNAVHRGAEDDIFPYFGEKDRPGMVSFTATCWGKLLNEGKLPSTMKTPSAGDCYRFALSNQMIDCCMMGVKNMAMLKENLAAIEQGPLNEEELQYMRRVGDHIYGKSRQSASPQFS